jgi:hypothetical protein
MSPQQLRAAKDDLYVVSVIADILQKLSTASISAGVKLDGPEVEWLAGPLASASEDAINAIMGPSPAGAA